MVSRTTGTGSPVRRMFAAVLPPAELVTSLGDRLDPLQVRWSQLRWTDAAGWHLTLAFMARVDAGQYDRLVENLTGVSARTARFDISLAGAGAFPAPPIGRNLWLGVYDPTDSLTRLAAETRRAVARSGVRTPDQKFTAHLTLARVPQPTDLSPQAAVLDEWSFGPWPVDELALVESQLGQGREGRPRYLVTDRFRLAEH
ncbi:MAG: RNA 2',3'-cyclic phosphodiesterase [Brooklawnia sp.]|uniref:RNA 2',3'-cyclic phosphodiesterase n=1 Tax=Brooklawnia sp. TaxID=2699740 RepID=UPI003C71F96B